MRTGSLYASHALIPWNIVHALSGGSGPRGRRIAGAILVADVAGYTALTERLSGRGDEGLGMLSDLLNRHFGRYIDVVSAHGGEMISFSGDALVAGFLDRPGSGDVSERAASCANALSNLAAGAARTMGIDRIVPHIGVASGSIWVACLGGWYGRWELLVGGQAVRDAFAASSAAERGEIVVTPVQGTVSPRSDPVPPAPVASASGMGPEWAYGLVHPRVLEAVTVEQSFASELRPVVSLFVRTAGLDEDDADAVERHQAWVYAVHAALRGVSSTGGRFLIDDKGLLFVLVLGDPGNAHTDDLERTLAFADELEERAGQLGLSTRMGLAAGRAFCGVIGNEHRRQYVVIGPPLNVAARLMDRAMHGLLAALPLPGHDRNRFALSLGDTLQLKGVERPVVTAQLERRRDAPPNPAAMRGRDEEKRRLERLLADARHGHGGLAVIVGDAGIGKSTMARWLVDQAGRSGVRCVLGEGDLTEASTPYFAFRHVVRTLVGGSMQDDAPTLADRLRRSLEAMGHPEFAPLFNVVLPLQLAETPFTRDLRGQRRAELLSELLVDLVKLNSEEPLLILIEDAHWLDSASARLVEQIRSRLVRPLLVLTARPEAETGTLHALSARGESTLRMELAPLDADTIRDVARSILGEAAAPPVIALIEKETGGNPFFVKEYIRELRDSGRLTLHGRAWELAAQGGAGGDSTSASPTLRGLITTRIDGLPPEPRKALKVASVLGRHVNLSILAHLLADAGAADPGEISGLVEAWARHKLTTSDPSEGESVRFAHALIQLVAYESLVVESRTRLHRAAALAIEGHQTREIGHHALLVHHWSRARDPAKTVVHAELAAEEAVRAGAHREARSFAELCVEQAAADPSLSSPVREVRWQVTLADAANGLGDVRQRSQNATRALVLAGRRIPRRRWSAALHGARALLARAIRHRLTPAGGGASGSAETLADYIARAYRQMAQVSYFENDPFRYLCFAAQSMVHAERAGQIGELSGALAELGGFFGYAGLGRLSRAYFSEAFELADRTGNADAAAHVNMVFGLAAVGRGRWVDAVTSLDRCQSLCARSNARVEWTNAQVIRFWCHYYQFQMAEAEGAAREIERSAREFGNAQQLAWGLHARGLCRVAAGAYAEARRILEQASELLEDGTDPNSLLETQGSLALAHSRSGDRPGGHALAREVLRRLRAIDAPIAHGLTPGLSSVAEIVFDYYEEHPAGKAAAEDARDVVAALKRQARVFPIAIPSYRYWEARLEVARGRSGARSLRRGLAAARLLGMPAEEQRIAASALG